MSLHLKTLYAALLGLAVSGAPTAAREVYPHGKIFSNVTAPDINTLLSNTARVSHWQNGVGMGQGGLIRVTWYDSKGRKFVCAEDDTEAYQPSEEIKWHGRLEHSRFLRLKHPLLISESLNDGSIGYDMLRYNATTGDLKTFIYSNRRWWVGNIGHLQKRIPAAVWKACPDFPSAKSLGAKVNKKQTSLHYYELLKQDKGQRILRPDLVTEDTVVPDKLPAKTTAEKNNFQSGSDR